VDAVPGSLTGRRPPTNRIRAKLGAMAVRVPTTLARPVLAVSRRVEFRGKRRLLHALGLSLDNRELVPRGVDQVRCVEGIRISTHDSRDVMFRELWLHGYYQDDVLVALANLLRPGDTFWDIGANFGLMSLWVDHRFGGAVRTVAFEPSPAVARTLRKNLALNHARAVAVEEICLSDRPGEVTFYTSADHSWNATLIPSFASKHGEDVAIRVNATTMDAYAAAHGPPTAIKLDVEGAEHLVIMGGQALLRDHDVAIVAEYNTAALAEVGLSPTQYLDLFTRVGYRPCHMRRPLWGWYRWNTLHEVADVATLPPLCNLVLLKRSPR